MVSGKNCFIGWHWLAGVNRHLTFLPCYHGNRIDLVAGVFAACIANNRCLGEPMSIIDTPPPRRSVRHRILAVYNHSEEKVEYSELGNN